MEQEQLQALARGAALLSRTRKHIKDIDDLLRAVAVEQGRESKAYLELQEQRRVLLLDLQETETLLREVAPERFSPQAQAAEPAQPRGEPPPFAAEMPRFGALLGVKGTPNALCLGKEVQNLQQLLAWLGFAVPVDGQFTGRTQQALLAWQKRQGLKPDGMTGAATRRALNALLDGGV